MVDVVGVGRGGVVHGGLNQPVVAVVDEAVLAALHEVAGGVVLVAMALAISEPYPCLIYSDALFLLRNPLNCSNFSYRFRGLIHAYDNTSATPYTQHHF